MKIRITLLLASTLSAAVLAVVMHAQSAGRRQIKRSTRFHQTHPESNAVRSQAIRSPSATDAAQLPDGLVSQVRVLQGYAIAPVKLNMEGKDPVLVGLGSYIVNSVGCNDCHTNPSYMDGNDPFKGQSPAKVNTAGYLGGGKAFGPVTSRNLTPEPEEDNKPAGMDFDEFLTIMRTGIDTDQKHLQLSPLLQTMPWPAIGQMTDYELRAIYEYLGAIPPVSIPGAK